MMILFYSDLFVVLLVLSILSYGLSTKKCFIVDMFILNIFVLFCVFFGTGKIGADCER